MSVDWQAVRGQFPALANWTYLNTATQGQLPRRVTQAVADHFAHRDELACGDFLSWFDDMDCVRAKVAQLIRCLPEDVAFVPNAATGLAILLAGLRWRPGDAIVTLQHEFPNNLYAPALLEEHGVHRRECPWANFYDAIDERTRLVALSSANYNTGFVPPLAEISAFLRQRGVLLFVDGTQSVGALQFDVSVAKPDVLVVHGYKWLISPDGAGFLYVRPEIRELLPPSVIGWRSHHDWRNVDNLHHGVPQLPAGAEKYEGGGIPFSLLYGMEAAIDLMLEIGPDNIERRVLGLAEQTRSLLRECGASVNSYASPIVAAQFEGRDVSQLARDLRAKRILVAARRGHLRVSPHFYNNEADLERLRKGLLELL